MLSYCHLLKGEAYVKVFREETIQRHCLKLNIIRIYNCKKMQMIYISIVKSLSDPSPFQKTYMNARCYIFRKAYLSLKYSSWYQKEKK